MGHNDIKLPTTQAGVHPATGILSSRGVKHIIHAVGPIWTDYKIADSTFKIVTKKIKLTVWNALNLATRIDCLSCALPAISGGIFTHYRVDSDIKEREQRAARKAVLEAVLQWAREHNSDNNVNTDNNNNSLTSSEGCSNNNNITNNNNEINNSNNTGTFDQATNNNENTNTTTDTNNSSNATNANSTNNVNINNKNTTLLSILICDLSPREKGSIYLFIEEFDAIMSQQK